jgi:hypothetical protein
MENMFALFVRNIRAQCTSITSRTIPLCCKGWRMILINLQLLMFVVTASKVTGHVQLLGYV